MSRERDSFDPQDVSSDSDQVESRVRIEPIVITTEGLRIDHAIVEHLAMRDRQASVREVRRALKSGALRVDGKRVAPGDPARAGMVIDVSAFISRNEAEIVPDHDLARRVAVLFEDEEILILAKPSGVPTTPIRPGESGTLLNAAVALVPSIANAGPALDGGAVHRLDRPTSGVVVFAKTTHVRATLRAAFGAHQIEKRYLAIVEGELEVGQRIRLDRPIVQAGPNVRVVDTGPDDTRARRRDSSVPKSRRDPPAQPSHEEAARFFEGDDRVRAKPAGALDAVSDVLVVGTNGERTLVEVTTRYGRRHQVRVHLADCGHPICGDDRYGGASSWSPRLALHAAVLTIPGRGRFEAPVPDDLAAFVEALS